MQLENELCQMIDDLFDFQVLPTKAPSFRMSHGVSKKYKRYMKKETHQAFKDFCLKIVNFDEIDKQEIPIVVLELLSLFLSKIKDMSIKDKLNYDVHIEGGKYRFSYRSENTKSHKQLNDVPASEKSILSFLERKALKDNKEKHDRNSGSWIRKFSGYHSKQRRSIQDESSPNS